MCNILLCDGETKQSTATHDTNASRARIAGFTRVFEQSYSRQIQIAAAARRLRQFNGPALNQSIISPQPKKPTMKTTATILSLLVSAFCLHAQPAQTWFNNAAPGQAGPSMFPASDFVGRGLCWPPRPRRRWPQLAFPRVSRIILIKSGSFATGTSSNAVTVAFGYTFSAVPSVMLTMTNVAFPVFPSAVTTSNCTANIATGTTNLGGMFIVCGPP